MKKRGQFSVEYLLVVGFALVIILPIAYYGYATFEQSRDEVAAASVNKIGYEIVNNAKSIYYLGDVSRVTLEMNFPEQLEDIQVITDPGLGQELLLIQVADSEFLFPSDVPLNYKFDPDNLNPGIKNVRLQSYGTFVNISIR
jgi:hypothetical protein